MSDRVKFSDVTQLAEQILSDNPEPVDITVNIRLDGPVAQKFELLRRISEVAFGLSREEFVAYIVTAGIHREMQTLARVRQENAGDA